MTVSFCSVINLIIALCTRISQNAKVTAGLLLRELVHFAEFVIPPEATVFYAMSSNEVDLKFKLRKKTPTISFLASLPKRSSSASRSRNPRDTLKKWSVRTVSVTRN